MLEHGRERPRVAGAHELEVARRESRSPARRRRGARRGSAARARRASSRPSSARRPAVASRTAAPDAARRRAAAAAPVHVEPMKQIPRLEHRRVERLAVEADERAGARRARRDDRRAAAARRRSRVSRILPRHERAIRRRTSRSRRETPSVPAPPLRPVVSRSKKTNGGRAGAPPANERRLAGRLVEARARSRRPRSRP